MVRPSLDPAHAGAYVHWAAHLFFILHFNESSMSSRICELVLRVVMFSLALTRLLELLGALIVAKKHKHLWFIFLFNCLFSAYFRIEIEV